MGRTLTGTRVLLVEDETLVAMLLEEGLEELGCDIVGPVGRIDTAKQAVDGGHFDCAVLDINLRGQPVYPVAEMLAARSVPFCFVTGYGGREIAAGFAERPVLHKPFSADELATVIDHLMQRKAAAAPPRKSR